MLSYHWNLPLAQPEDNPPLHLIQQALFNAGFFLDFSLADGMVRLTIQEASPEGGVQGGSQQAENPPERSGAAPAPDAAGTACGPSPDAGSPPVRPESPKKRRGRSSAVPKKDISIRQAREMRSEGLTLEEIAAHIGISRRTFFRRWRDITNGEADPDTPFSRWSDS